MAVSTLAVLVVSAYEKPGRMIPSGRASFVRCIDGSLTIIRNRGGLRHHHAFGHSMV